MLAIVLRVDGEVEHPLALTLADLSRLPAQDQVKDVSRFHPTRKGDGVTLQALLDRAGPKSTASYLTLHATADNFAASIPLDAVRSEGIVVYQLDGHPLPVEKGGPIRFLIKDPAACNTDELDDCANVKFVDRIELTAGRGRDTRPHDEAEHEKLHEKE